MDLESPSLPPTRILHILILHTLTRAIPITVIADTRTLTMARMLTRIGAGADTRAAIGVIPEVAITDIADTPAGLGVTATVAVTAIVAITGTVADTAIAVDTATVDMAAEASRREAVVSAAAILAEDLRGAAEAGVSFAAR